MKSFSRDTPSFATFSAISAALHQKVVTENLGHRIGGHDPVKGKSPGFPRVQNRHSGFFLQLFSTFFACCARSRRRGASLHDEGGRCAARWGRRGGGRRSPPSSR